MNDDQIKQQLMDYLSKVESAAINAADFAKTEGMEAANEYVRYVMWSGFAHLMVATAIAVAILFLRSLLINDIKIDDSLEESDKSFGIFCVRCAALILLVIFCVVPAGVGVIPKMMKAGIAPRIVVLEKIQDLLK